MTCMYKDGSYRLLLEKVHQSHSHCKYDRTPLSYSATQPRACLDNSTVLFPITTLPFYNFGKKNLNKSKGQTSRCKDAIQRQHDSCVHSILSGLMTERLPFFSPPLFWDTEQRTVAATVNMWCRFNLGSNWKSPPVRVQSRSCWRLGRLSIDTQGLWDVEHGGKILEIWFIYI